MTTSRSTGPRRAAALVLAGLALLATGCSAASSGAAPPPHGSTGTASPAAADATPSGTPTVSTEASDLPPGLYRTRLTRDEIISLGGDEFVDAGTWTLIVTKDEYRLECKPVADPGEDCGSSLPTQTLMELGPLRGRGGRAWFVVDMKRKSALIGCTVNSSAGNGCGANDPYSLKWRRTESGLAFSDYVGLGDQAGGASLYGMYTLRPWDKIA